MSILLKTARSLYESFKAHKSRVGRKLKSAIFREKANLAVSLNNAMGDVLAHAAFLDYPLGDIVDQACWEPLMHDHFKAEKCTVSIKPNDAELCLFYLPILVKRKRLF